MAFTVMSLELSSFGCVCSFWFRFVTLWQKMKATPRETYRAVKVTSLAAKDVVQDMVTDSVDRARHAVEEARAVAERSRANAELMEDKPCPDVRLAYHPTLFSYPLQGRCVEDLYDASYCRFQCLFPVCLLWHMLHQWVSVQTANRQLQSHWQIC